MIKVLNLSKSFGQQRVLDDITLEIPKGQIIALLGESGTGKSVFLKTLMGLMFPDKGSVFIDDKDITNLKEEELLKIRKHMGYLFQEGALYDFMNVFENIAFPIEEHTSFKQDKIDHEVSKILKWVDLKGFEDRYPSELSGGMKKRVGLARAVALKANILLCDEPTSGLDPIRSRDISALILDVSKAMNATTIITSHDIDNALSIADRVLLLKNGKIIIDASPKQVYKSKDPFVKSFISKEKVGVVSDG